MMNKKLIIASSIVIILAIVGFIVLKKNKNPNNEAPVVVETPPQVQKINSLPLLERPYVTLIPHSNPKTCSGVELAITNLKKGEKNAEYDLEYTNAMQTGTKIEAIFGRRDFTVEKQHDPLELGTCSRGKCVCHDKIQGGSLKLTFTGDEEYVLKGDFSVENVGLKKGVLVSKDVRLIIETGDVLSDQTNVMIMNTFGLPADLSDKIILGPYGIYIEEMPKLKSPLKASIQTKDAAAAKVQLWDGTAWQVLPSKAEDNKLVFELPSLGVMVVTE